MSTASLVIVEGVGRGTRFQIGRQRVGIGRSSENAVRVADSEASRFHAAIQWQPEGWELLDLGSANGTLLNGNSIKRAAVVHGDQLQVANTLLQFELLGEAARAIDVPVSLVGDANDPSWIVGESSGVVSAEDAATPTGDRGAELVTSDSEALASLRAMYRISEHVADPGRPLDTMLEAVLDVALDVVSADRGCVLMANPDSGRLEPRVYRQSASSERAATEMPVPRSIVDLVMKEGRGVRTSDAQQDDRFSSGESIQQAGVREAVCAPLVGRQRALGVIYVDTTSWGNEILGGEMAAERLSEESLKLLVAMGHQAALAIDLHDQQDALLQSERLAAVGQTIATLSHHIKNILQGARGGSYLVNLGLKDHDEPLIRKGWGIVDRNQGRIYDLVMDMLSYSVDRIPVWKSVDLLVTVREVHELLLVRAEDARVRLVCRLPGSSCVADCDPEGIHRAVLNVATNALEAVEGRADAIVTLTAGFDSSSDTVWVDVDDNGPGIPEDEMPRLFNLFESTKGARGTGLGLAVSRKIIGEHGGEIHVENRPGAGCRFRLTWPRKSPDQRSTTGAELKS